MKADDLKSRIRDVIVEELMLDLESGELDDSTPLFDPEGIGLDSVDALQLVVAIEKHFGLKIDTAAKAKEILTSIDTIAAAIGEEKAAPCGDQAGTPSESSSSRR